MLERETGLSIRLLRQVGGGAQGWTSLSKVAAALELSRPHAAKLARRLVALGLMEGRQGARGGFRLTAQGRTATFLDVARALADPFVDANCFLGRRSCAGYSRCPMHDCWTSSKDQLIAALASAAVIP